MADTTTISACSCFLDCKSLPLSGPGSFLRSSRYVLACSCGSTRCLTHPSTQAVSRDIWALHLTLLPTPPTAEPYFHAQSQYGSTPPSLESRQTGVKPQQKLGHDHDTGSEQDSENERSTSSSDEEEEDPELERLLRENSVEPSSSDEEEDDLSNPLPQLKDQQAKNKTTFRPYDSPAGNIAILMLTCWTLRLPVMYMDFKRYSSTQHPDFWLLTISFRLIERYDLPYLDPLRLLPEELTLHLTKQTSKALSPQANNLDHHTVINV